MITISPSRDFHSVLSKFIKEIINSEFVKNVMVIMSGSLIAQVIAMGAAPIITRLFTPENFGELALFTSIVTIFASISPLCYDRAILLPGKKEEAVNLLVLSIAVIFATTSIISLIILCFKSNILGLLNREDFGVWLILIPVVIFIYGLSHTLSFWRVRSKSFKTLSFSKAGQSLVTALIKIALGFLVGAYAFNLIVGFIAGIIVSLLILASRPEKISFKKYLPDVSFSKIKILASRYKNFPLFSTWSMLLISLSRDIIVFLLLFLYSPAEVGFYSLGNRLLARPIDLVSQSVLRVYFQKASQDLSRGIDLRRSLKKITFGLILTGILPVIILGVLGKSIFMIVFGQEWATAGIYAQIMAPWYFMIYICGPSNVIFEVYQKQGIKLIINIAMMVMRFFALFLGYYISYDPLLSLGLFVVVNIVFHSIIIVLAFSIAKRADLQTSNMSDLSNINEIS